MLSYIRKILLNLKDEEYRKFTLKLIPNIEENKVIGVRAPKLREIIKNELKSIQKTLDYTISDMRKLDVSKLSQEDISNEEFKNMLQKLEDISKNTKAIITKIETGKNDEVNEMINEYSEKVEKLKKE